MSDIFRTLCQDITSVRKFDICDDRKHQGAYIAETDGQKWSAVVYNHHNRTIVFTALHNCIEFNKPDGNKESRCEGMLTYDDTIIFIEIKVRKGDAKTSAKKADDQLRNSIEIIGDKRVPDSFSNRKAYICNRHQKNLNSSHVARSAKFQDDTDYLLHVKKRINIG